MQNSENYKLYEQSDALVEFLRNQFGFAEDFFKATHFYTLENSSIVYMLNSELNYPGKIAQIGLPIFKGDFPKGYITNSFIYRYGKLATKNIVIVDDKDIFQLINREGIMLPDGNYEKGHHIVKYGSKILGRGWIREGLLFLDAPKIWRQNLLG